MTSRLALALAVLVAMLPLGHVWHHVTPTVFTERSDAVCSCQTHCACCDHHHAPSNLDCPKHKTEGAWVTDHGAALFCSLCQSGTHATLEGGPHSSWGRLITRLTCTNPAPDHRESPVVRARGPPWRT